MAELWNTENIIIYFFCRYIVQGVRQQQADWTLDMRCAALTVCRWSCWSVRQAWQLNWRRSSVLLASSVSFMRLVGSPGHQPVEATGPVVPGPGERDDRA